MTTIGPNPREIYAREMEMIEVCSSSKLQVSIFCTFFDHMQAQSEDVDVDEIEKAEERNDDSQLREIPAFSEDLGPETQKRK